MFGPIRGHGDDSGNGAPGAVAPRARGAERHRLQGRSVPGGISVDMGLNPVKQRLPLGLWQTLALGVAAALALGTLYYGVSLAHESVFNDERAFRVLGDVSTQFKSLETSRATILRTMP